MQTTKFEEKLKENPDILKLIYSRTNRNYIKYFCGVCKEFLEIIEISNKKENVARALKDNKTKMVFVCNKCKCHRVVNFLWKYNRLEYKEMEGIK